jgi:hypothetical protein
MPGCDRTGPWGQGPRSGGGFGVCVPQTQNIDVGFRGYGRGAGRGGRGLQRGFRRGFCFFGRGRGGIGSGGSWLRESSRPGPIKSNLEAEAAGLRSRLDAVEQRLAGMQGRGAEPKRE